MSRRSLLLVCLLAGCSYDWGSVQPYYERDASLDGFAGADPRTTVLPIGSCNPVSNYGCTSSYCLGMIEEDQRFSSITCSPPLGSGSQGSYCDGASNCVPGFVCWTNPADASDTSCEEPCFDDSDCASGACDTGGSYRVAYGRTTLYRCF